MNVTQVFSRFVFEPSILLGNVFYSIALVLSLYRKRKKNNLLVFFMHILSVLTLEMLITMFFAFFLRQFYIYSFYIKHFLVSVFYILPFSFLNKKGKMSSKISIVCCIYAMFFVLGEIGGCVPILVKELTYSKILDSIIRNAINASIILFGLFVHRFNLNRISKVPTIGIIFLVSYSSCEFLLAFFSGMKIHSTEFLFSLFEFLAFLIICFLNYLAYFMIYEICLKNDQFSQLQQKNYELEKDKQLIMVSNENLQKLRSIKHDMINQYSTMKILLEKKDYAELENFLQNYQDGVIQPLSFISCDNDILSSVINMEHSKAQSEGIDFDCKLAVRKSLPFNSSDLVSLLSNLLDNALEACLYYNVEKKVIKIRVREYQDYLFIEVTNPVGKGITLEEIKKNKTTKKDKTIHGFGNKIISNIVKKYEGILKKQIIDDSYVVKIMLKEKKDEEA